MIVKRVDYLENDLIDIIWFGSRAKTDQVDTYRMSGNFTG